MNTANNAASSIQRPTRHSQFIYMQRVAVRLLAFCILAHGVSASASINLVNLATGLDSGNNLLTIGGQSDAHWMVDQIGGGVAAAQIVAPGSADWSTYPWPLNGPNSSWIARNANTPNNGPGPYTFYRSFDLTGYDRSKVSISGAWAIDDEADLYLNGNHIANSGRNTWYSTGSLSPFSIPEGSPFLEPGLNALTITYSVADNIHDAVRFEGFVEIVPEPSSLTLLGLASVGMFCTGRRVRNMSGKR